MRTAMSRFRSFIVLAFVIAATAPAAAVKPNIVFILADDLGWGDIAAYGHPYAKTPISINWPMTEPCFTDSMLQEQFALRAVRVS